MRAAWYSRFGDATEVLETGDMEAPRAEAGWSQEVCKRWYPQLTLF